MSVSLQGLILEGEKGLAKINNLVHLALEGNRNELFVSEGTLTYAPAVRNPEKIICVGLNYIDHAKESNMDTPKSPVLFNKFNSALSAH